MPSHCSQYAVNRIVGFKCPETLKSSFNAPDEWFDTIGGIHYLTYRPNPGEYSIIREGERTRFQKTATSRLVNIRLQDSGFSIQMTVDDFRMRYLFEELAAICISSDLKKATLMTVIDYVDPGPAAFKAAVPTQGNPFRIRYGLLEIERSSGANGKGIDLYGVDGFRVIFRDRQGGFV